MKKLEKKPLYLELIQEELNDKEDIICLKTQGNLLYQTSAKKVTVKTFNFHHQKKLIFALKITIFFLRILLI